MSRIMLRVLWSCCHHPSRHHGAVEVQSVPRAPQTIVRVHMTQPMRCNPIPTGEVSTPLSVVVYATNSILLNSPVVLPVPAASLHRTTESHCTHHHMQQSFCFSLAPLRSKNCKFSHTRPQHWTTAASSTCQAASRYLEIASKLNTSQPGGGDCHGGLRGPAGSAGGIASGDRVRARQAAGSGAAAAV
jgi:hypothetical protein